VIRGTWVTVEQLPGELGEDASTEAVVATHPRLTPGDVRAPQLFAADYMAGDNTPAAE